MFMDPPFREHTFNKNVLGLLIERSASTNIFIRYVKLQRRYNVQCQIWCLCLSKKILYTSPDRDLDSSQYACKFYSPSRGRTQPLSQSHADLRDKMGVVLHYFKVLYIILYWLLLSLILLRSYIYFSFYVIQSSLCEMTLLLLKINWMLRSFSTLFMFM